MNILLGKILSKPRWNFLSSIPLSSCASKSRCKVILDNGRRLLSLRSVATSLSSNSNRSPSDRVTNSQATHRLLLCSSRDHNMDLKHLCILLNSTNSLSNLTTLNLSHFRATSLWLPSNKHLKLTLLRQACIRHLSPGTLLNNPSSLTRFQLLLSKSASNSSGQLNLR